MTATNDPEVFLEDDPATAPETTIPDPPAAPAVMLDEIPFTTSAIRPGEPDDDERRRLIRTIGTAVLAVLLCAAVYLAFAAQSESDSPAALSPADEADETPTSESAPTGGESPTSESASVPATASTAASSTPVSSTATTATAESTTSITAGPTTAPSSSLPPTTQAPTNAPSTTLLSTTLPSSTTTEATTTSSTVATTRAGGDGPLQIQGPGSKVSFLERDVSEFFIAVGGGTEPVRFAAENLPTGLVLDEQTGEVRGRPSVPGVYSVSVTVSNSNESFTQGFTWVVVD